MHTQSKQYHIWHFYSFYNVPDINDLVYRLQEGQLYSEIQVDRLVLFSHGSVSGVTLGMIIHHFYEVGWVNGRNTANLS